MQKSGRAAAILATTVLAVAGSVFGPPWAALAYNSLSYPTTAAGEAGNVVMRGDTAYASLAEDGFAVVDASRGRLRVVPPPPGSESVDDLAVAGHLLFVLDARRPGHLSVFSLADAENPALVSPPVAVEVGPFSGVSAGGGRVVVSGGTSRMSLRAYDREGRVGAEIASADFGRGQPDVLLSPDGARAFVSTHRWGPHFGLTVVDVGADPGSLIARGGLDLDTFGFTAGGARPANFPVEPALAGDVVLIAHVRGLAVVAVEDPGKPRLISVLDLGMEPVNVDAQGGLAAVVGSSPSPTLVLVDVTTPATPKIVRSVALPQGSMATGVAVGPASVAVAAGRKGVLIHSR